MSFLLKTDLVPQDIDKTEPNLDGNNEHSFIQIIVEEPCFDSDTSEDENSELLKCKVENIEDNRCSNKFSIEKHGFKSRTKLFPLADVEQAVANYKNDTNTKCIQCGHLLKNLRALISHMVKTHRYCDYKSINFDNQ